MGRLVVTEYEVTEFVESERWGMRSVTGPLSMAGTLSCAPSRYGHHGDHQHVLRRMVRGGHGPVR